MHTFPVILGYYANARQILTKLSQRNLTKMQAAIKNKSIHYSFTMASATEDTGSTQVINYACISFAI